jgi:phage gp29-like protein
VDKIQSEGEGQAFLSAIELYNREITHAVLKQTRATMEAQHGSRADSQTATDILDVVVGWVQGVLARAFRAQVVRRLVLMNFGSTAARELCPQVLFSGSGKPDFAATALAVAQLQSAGYLAASQLAGIDQMLSLPVRAAPVKGER